MSSSDFSSTPCLDTSSLVVPSNVNLVTAVLNSRENPAQSLWEAPIALVLLNPDSVILDVNSEFVRLTGYEFDELILSSAVALDLWPNRWEEEIPILRIEEGGLRQRRKLTVQTKAGELTRWQGSFEPVSIENELYLIGGFVNASQLNTGERSSTHLRTDLPTISDLIHDLTDKQQNQTLLPSILNRAVKLLKLTHGAIYQCNRLDRSLVLRYADGQGLEIGRRVLLGQGLVGRVAVREGPLVINNSSEWANLDDPSLPVDYISAAFGLPIRCANEVLGVLMVADRQPHSFEQETPFLTTMADLAASAFNDERLNVQVRALSHEAIGNGQSPITVLPTVADRLRLLTPRQREVILLLGQGCNNTQISSKLGIRMRTIETHRSAAIQRLRLESGQELIHFATQCVMETFVNSGTEGTAE